MVCASSCACAHVPVLDRYANGTYGGLKGFKLGHSKRQDLLLCGEEGSGEIAKF